MLVLFRSGVCLLFELAVANVYTSASLNWDELSHTDLERDYDERTIQISSVSLLCVDLLIHFTIFSLGPNGGLYFYSLLHLPLKDEDMMDLQHHVEPTNTAILENVHLTRI